MPTWVGLACSMPIEEPLFNAVAKADTIPSVASVVGKEGRGLAWQ